MSGSLYGAIELEVDQNGEMTLDKVNQCYNQLLYQAGQQTTCQEHSYGWDETGHLFGVPSRAEAAALLWRFYPMVCVTPCTNSPGLETACP